MGKIESGILGGFRGKVGTVVGYIQNGECIIRMYRRTINASRSIAALTVRSKFKMANDLIKPLAQLFKAGFSGTKNPSQWHPNALGTILKRATEGIYPTVSINFEKVAFSDGPGTQLTGFAGSVTPNTREVTLNWDSENDYPDNAQNDNLVVIALNTSSKKYWSQVLPEKRSIKTSSLLLPEFLGTGTIHLFAYTISPTIDSKLGKYRISPSVCGGTVTLA